MKESELNKIRKCCILCKLMDSLPEMSKGEIENAIDLCKNELKGRKVR